MDTASFIGLALGVLFVLFGSLSAANNEVLSWFKLFFFQPPAIAITLGGTLAATLLHYPLAQVKSLFPIVRHVFSPTHENPAAAIDVLITLAEKARRDGLLSLEPDLEMQGNTFLKKGIQLVIDGTDPELVREILEIDIEYLEERHKAGVGFFESLAHYAPAFGLIGTLIGLTGMLLTLGMDVSAMGPNMATALVSTLYGVIIANCVCLPIAGKLKVRSAEEIQMRQVLAQGVICIQEGNNPRIIRQKLTSFLAPNIRERIEARSERKRVA